MKPIVLYECGRKHDTHELVSCRNLLKNSRHMRSGCSRRSSALKSGTKLITHGSATNMSPVPFLNVIDRHTRRLT